VRRGLFEPTKLRSSRVCWFGPFKGHKPFARHFHVGRLEHQKEHQLHLFFRLLSTFGFLALLLIGGLGTLVFLISRFFPGSGETSTQIWIASLSLAMVIPLLGWGWAVHSFKHVAGPLADIIQAADAVARGRLDTRVPEGIGGEFGRLAQTFNKMAMELENADRQRRNMMADIAHELRTPLHILQGNLEGLQDGIYQPTADQFQIMLNEMHRLGRLVEDLRTLSLAEAGRLPLNREAINVGELLADIGTSFGVLAEDAGIDLRVTSEGEASAAVLDADMGRLHQVLGNLITNALRHTPRGGTITLTAVGFRPSTIRNQTSGNSDQAQGTRTQDSGLSTQNPELASSFVQVSVQDTGTGIPPEELPCVFDRYWRGECEPSRGGSGLGLAIARRLVELHGGQISVDSEPGRGTTFTILLPTIG